MTITVMMIMTLFTTCLFTISNPTTNFDIYYIYTYSIHDSAVVVTKLLSNNNIIITDTVLALFIVPN